MKVGIEVVCLRCGCPKAPRGRSVPDLTFESWCTSQCVGHAAPPFAGDLWPGETDEDFGYQCSDNATEPVERQAQP